MFQKNLRARVYSQVLLLGLWTLPAQAFLYSTLDEFGDAVQADIPYGCASLATYGGGMYRAGSVYDPWSGCNPNDTRFKSSASITALTTLRTATAQVLDLVAARVEALHQAPLEGVVVHRQRGKKNDVSGSSPLNAPVVSVWANTGWSHPHNAFVSTNFEGDVFTAMVGGDYAWLSTLHTGLGLGLERTGYSTRINQGQINGTGVSAVPYLSYRYSKRWNFDAAIGGSYLNYDMRRRDPSLTGSIYRITGETNGRRLFGAVNAKAQGVYRDFKWLGKTGIMAAREWQSQFVDSDSQFWGLDRIEVGRLEAGAEVGYPLNPFTEPFVGLRGLWDFRQTKTAVFTREGRTSITGTDTLLVPGQAIPPQGAWAVLYTLGMRFVLEKDVQATFSATREAFREQFYRNALMFGLNADF